MKHLKLFSSSGCSADAQHPVSRLSRFDSVSIVSRQSVLGLLLLFLTAFSGSVWGAEVTVAKNLSDVATANEWSTSAGTDVTTYTSWNVDANITVSVNESGNNGSYWSNGWRCYESSSAAITIAAPNGYTIKSVTITYASTKNNGCITGVTSGTAKTVNAQSVTYNVSHSSGSNKGQVGITAVSVTYESPASTNPDVSLTPSSLENLAATDVEDQEITVACTNFANAITSVTAALYSNSTCTEEYTVDPWATNIAVNDAKTKVSFSVADNDGAARQAWLKVTATDGTSTESAILPISQKAAPLTTMDAIFAAATANGNTAKEATITFNNWVVSAVNGSNVYVTDGTKGFVIYKSSHGFAVNDKLNGTVVGSLKLYNGFAEEVSITASAEGLTVTKDGTITPVELDAAGIDALSGVNTGSVINLRGKCTKSDDKYYVAGVQLYNSLYSYSVTANHSYDVTGVYTQFNSTKEVLPRSAADIEEIPTPLVTVKNNAEVPETITSMAFGNVGQRWQQSFVFGFSYENLEAGDLTMTIGGTNASAFAFYGGELTETVEISSAGSGSVSSLSFRQATEVAGTYNATLTISGCGLLEDVELPITMTVKAPEFTYTPATIAFGDVKQHTKATETFTLTGKYLKKEGWSNVKMLSTGIFDPLSEAESYFISSDENGEINETVTVTCDATDASAGAAAGKLTLKSMETIAEFEDKEDVVSFSATVVATYPVRFQVNDNDRGTITINGEESDEDGKVTVYVVDDNEQITMEATPKLGWKLNNWQVANADESKVMIDDAESDDTYAYVSAEPEDYITAVFIKDCTPLARPSNTGYITTTYNSANLRWQWVWEDENKAATYHIHAFETENPSEEIDVDIELTSAEMEESNVYRTLTGLKGNTAYTIQIWGTSVAVGFCPTGEVAEFELTTAPYPAATLTLSENGVERTWGSDLKVASEIELPAAPAVGLYGKVFIGWITESSYSHATDAPANIKKAGEKYTVAAVADKLYAVYATETPGANQTYTLDYDTDVSSKTLGYGSAVDVTATDGSAWVVKAYKNSGMQINNSKDASIKVPTCANNILNIAITCNSGAKNAVGFSAADYSGSGDIEYIVYSSSSSTSQTLDFTGKSVKGGYIVPKAGNCQITKIVVTSAGAPTYSDYATNGPALSAPTFTPAQSETVYTEALDVTISAAAGTIHYTTDGTEPTASSPTYTSAITLNKYGVNTVKAIAIDGVKYSNVATATYTIKWPFASLEALVAADLDMSVDQEVTVSFSDVEITEIKTGEIFLNVKDENEKNISIYVGEPDVPTGWSVGGKVSGTAIVGLWVYDDDEYYWLMPNNDWTGITYKAPSGLAWSDAEATAYTVGKSYSLPTLTNPNSLTVAYSSSNTDAATINAETGAISIVAAGTTTITATFAGNDDYIAKEVSYELTVVDVKKVVVTGTPKTAYDYDESFSFTGLGAKAIYNNDEEYDIPSGGLSSWTATPTRITENGKVKVTVTWATRTSEIREFDVTVIPNFYITGTAVGATEPWNPALVPVIGATSYTIDDLEPGSYSLKITTDGTWSTVKGFDDLTPSEMVAGLYRGTGEDTNIYFTLKETSDVTVTYDGEIFKLAGNFLPQIVSVKGAWDSWAAHEMTLSLDKKSASVSFNIAAAENVEFGVLINTDDYRANSASFDRSHTSETGITGNTGNMKLTSDKTDTYTFTWTFGTNALSITFPEQGGGTALDNAEAQEKAVKFIENNQIFIRRGDKTFNAQGQLVK